MAEKMNFEEPSSVSELEDPDGAIERISRDAGRPEGKSLENDIRQRALGNRGAASVLGQLAGMGEEVYNKIAPELGFGSEIWVKYNDECGQSMDKLKEKYSPKE